MVPTSLIRNRFESAILIPNWPNARTGTNRLYFGSCICIGEAVPPFISSENALFINQTSAENGDFLPKGILMSFWRTGMLSVDRTYLPGPKTSVTWPFFKSIASCDSFTMSWDHVASSELGYFQAKISAVESNFNTSAIAIIIPPVYLHYNGIIFKKFCQQK